MDLTIALIKISYVVKNVDQTLRSLDHHACSELHFSHNALPVVVAAAQFSLYHQDRNTGLQSHQHHAGTATPSQQDSFA